MATSSSYIYKQYNRQSRVLTVEESYANGMYYTDNPIPPGFCKLLVNYVLKNTGDSLSPRGGLKTVSLTDLGIPVDNYIIHHTGQMYINDVTNDDAYIRRYVLIGPEDESKFGVKFKDSIVLVEDPDTNTFIQVTKDESYTGNAILKYYNNDGWKYIHEVPILQASPRALCTTLESIAYMIYKEGTTTGLAYLEVTDTDGVLKSTLKIVEPADIDPAQAINYGYNMLKDKPYNFTNKENATGGVQLLGVLPYDDAGILKFNAKVGESINFELIYSYPSTHKENKTYKVQWEVQDINTDAAPTVIQKLSDSSTYAPGDIIKCVIKPPFKQFSVIAKLYDAAVTTEPLKVIQLAAYYLATDSKSTTLNISPKTYNLGTATGMITWQGRLVIWGVNGAKGTLFMSDINQPNYFPFPNGAEIFEEDIITVVPYLNNILVFTESRLYLIALSDDSTYYTKKCIQEKLNISKHDQNTIQVVKNMVYFKSNNYYYMVVPNTKVGAGELQLAPISKPIEGLLDNFNTVVKTIVDTVYNISFSLKLDVSPWDLTLVDYYNYLDGYQMHNIYRYSLTVDGEHKLMVEISLIYDTMLRCWTVHTTECTKHRLIPYQQMVTEDTIYVHLIKQLDGNTAVQLVQRDNASPKDEFILDEEAPRLLPTVQFMDTGYRDQDAQHKKRFREIQFKVNNVSQSRLKFYTSFLVDDEMRKALFKYESVHITDPEDPNYGLIHIERSYEAPEEVYGTTILGESEEDYNAWTLDFSQFPKLTVVKVRCPVSGKGYAGRLRLLSVNETMYELLNNNWVYRPMNAR